MTVSSKPPSTARLLVQVRPSRAQRARIDAALERVRDIARRKHRSGRSVVDDFIAERRAETA